MTHSTVESIEGIRPEIQAAISGAVDNCLTATHLPLPARRQVRWQPPASCLCNIAGCPSLQPRVR